LARRRWSPPAPVAAQLPEVPDPDTVRMRAGPFYLNPSLSLTNMGVDTNVFNEADVFSPKSDFTMTLTPASDVWLRVGPTWLAGRVREDVVWYKDYASERSLNHSATLGWLVPLNRLSFSVGGTWADTRERPGLEIDARVDRREQSVLGSAELRVLTRTLLGVRGERRQVRFGEDATFLGSSLQLELNRTITSGAVSIRHELTPLTSIAVNAGRDQERFEYSPIRDADSTRLGVGVYFDPFALISGSAQFGYRDFVPHAAEVPGYEGIYAAAGLTYVALGTTKISVQVIRDVQYSFEVDRPYFLQTGVDTTVAQQIYGPVDVEGRAAFQRLAYRSRTGLADLTDRLDRVRLFRAGAGYWVGEYLRVAFNVDFHARSSPSTSREYDGARYGLAVTYGVR
jgi:hypothetical protein